MNQVAEGVKTARVVLEIAEHYGVDMPITAEVASVVGSGRSAAEAYSGLLNRRVGHEVEYGG